jgi:thiamine-monophosphate kinase
MSSTGEFEFIRQRLAPLAANYPGAFDLTDDAAVLSVPDGQEIVVTSDTLIEGVHFLADDPANSVAIKALRVSVSDLSAMGATPSACMLSISWPREGSDEQRERFVDGLAQECAARGISLIGGDTTVTDGPWTVTGTLFGLAPKGGVVRRSGARPGDILAVTGSIGNSGLGLQVARGTVDLNPALNTRLVKHYRVPPVRSDTAGFVRQFASAAIDISDGLIADSGHLANASGVGICLELQKIPVSAGLVEFWLRDHDSRIDGLVFLATCGDDYELLLSIPADRFEAAAVAFASKECALTAIGHVVKRRGVTVLGEGGAELQIGKAGFTHF